MTKELRYKMQLMMTILLQRKCLMIKLRVFNFFYCNSLSHKNSQIVGLLTSGASDLISNSAHFSFKTATGHVTLNISRIYEIHFYFLSHLCNS